MIYMQERIEKLLRPIISNIDACSSVAIYPMGYYGEIVKNMISKYVKQVNVLCVDNYNKEYISLSNIDNPIQYSWIISCENVELQEELLESLKNVSVTKNIFYLFPNKKCFTEIEVCPICQSENVKKIQRGIYRCNDCTHAFKKYVDNIVLDKYYDKAYWEEDKNRQGITSVGPSEEWNEWLQGRIDILNRLEILNVSDPSNFKILEFGCSEGMLLYELKKRGFCVKGNDVCAIQEDSVSKLGIDISTLPIEEYAKSDERFNLIMSFHCVEHLRNPLNVMKDLSNMLAPSGLLLMLVPIDDNEFDNPDHYHFFTKESGIKLLESVVKDIKADISYYNINDDVKAVAGTFVGIKKD